MHGRLLAAICVFGLWAGSNTARADTFVFDFENLAESSGNTNLVVQDRDGFGVQLLIERPIFNSTFDIVDLGFEPGSALDAIYGRRTLSPFPNTTFDPFVFTVSGLTPPGQILTEVRWSMGDYLGDIDGVYIESGTGAGVINGFLPIDHLLGETDGSFGRFASFEGALGRSSNIDYWGISAGSVGAENSMFIDSITLVFADVPGGDFPISGGGGNPGAGFEDVSTPGDDGGEAAPPVPEPGTLALLALGLAAGAVLRRRKRS